MNFVYSSFPDCQLWVENSASFHHLSSTWIPVDLHAAIAACFVFAINPFIVTHTHRQWVSALVAVIWSHRFCLQLKDASAHCMKWLFTHSRPSFCVPLKSLTLRHLTLLFRNSQKEDFNSRDSSVICSWGCIAAPASCWASISPLAFIFLTRLCNKANASNSSFHERLLFYQTWFLNALSIAPFADSVLCVLSLDQRAWYPFNSIWITSALPALIIFLAVFASASTPTSACLFVVYFHFKMLVLLHSFIHAIVLFSLLHFHLLLKQHVKRLLEITPTAAVVICSGRGGKCNGTHTMCSGRSNHSNDGAKSITGVKWSTATAGATLAPLTPPL